MGGGCAPDVPRNDYLIAGLSMYSLNSILSCNLAIEATTIKYAVSIDFTVYIDFLI